MRNINKLIITMLIILLFVNSSAYSAKLEAIHISTKTHENEKTIKGNTSSRIMRNIMNLPASKPLSLFQKTFELSLKIRLKQHNNNYQLAPITENPTILHVRKPITKIINLPYHANVIDVRVGAGSITKLLGYKVYSGIDPMALKRQKYLVLWFAPSDQDEIVVNINIKYRYRHILNVHSGGYDVLIITSKDLLPAAQLLAKLKQKENLTSKIAFVEDIYASMPGRDRQEKIRNYIKQEVSNNGIKFVVLLGDDDVVPARLAYIPDGAFDDNPELDGSYVETDLYYADLDYTWDDNNDGRWGDLRFDRVDGLPDVIVGRIPASNLTEALGIVRKIENYHPFIPLYSRVVLAGTDTFQIGYPEGEYLLEYVRKYLKNMTKITLYETANNLTRDTFIKAMDDGAYATLFTGHGLPDRLALTFSQTYSVGDALMQKNKIYPIFVALSCDAGRFVGIDGVGEALVINPNGGAIAFIGSTRIAWGYIGELVTQGLMGEIFWRTVKNIFNDSIQYLGEVWAQTVREYALNNPINMKLTGYYINWKTVAEYNLLGDPTLIIRRQSLNENGNMEITNQIATLSGGHYQEISINSSEVTISNTSIVADEIVANNSTITIRNATIKAENIILVNSTLIIENSQINAEISSINSTIRSSASTITSMQPDKKSTLIMINSTTRLELTNITNIENLKQGNINFLNLSNIGYKGNITSSVVLFSIANIYTSIELHNTTISELTLVNSSANITNSEILMLTLNNSEVNVSQSTLGIKLIITNANLEIGREILNQLIAGTTIQGTANITTIKICSVRSILNISATNISEVLAEDSLINVENGDLKFLSLSQSKVNLQNSSIMILNGNLNATLENVSIDLAHVSGNITLSNSRIVVLYISHGNVNISDSRIYSLYVNSSRISINNSTILEGYLTDSHIFVVNGRATVIDLHGDSYMALNSSLVSYWLRLYDESSAEMYNSTVWMGLTFNANAESTIENLTAGYIERDSFDIGNYSISIKKSTVLAWDIISYGADLHILNSDVGYIYAYYNTTLQIEGSSVLLLRATHNSSISIELAGVSGIYASGESIVSVEDSIVGTVYVLGESRIRLAYTHFDTVRGFGSSRSSVTIVKSQGGVLIGLYNTTFSVIRSKLNIYLVYTNKSVALSRLLPKYLSYWNASSLNVDSKIVIYNSWISWSIYAENSNITLSDSLLRDCYLESSDAEVNNVSISGMWVSYSSKVDLKDSSLAGISIFWDSKANVEDASIVTLYVIRSQLILKNSFVIPVLMFLKGNHSVSVKPGFFESETLSKFVNTTDETLNITFENTSVGGWAVIAVGQEGSVRVNVEDSVLMGLGGAVNVNLSVRNSYVYGYSQFIVGRNYNTTVKLENVSTRMMLTFYRMEEVNLNSSLLRGFSGELAGIVMKNVTIRGWYISSTYTDLVIENLNVNTINVRGANLLILKAKIDTLEVIGSSNTTIYNSRISNAKIALSAINIEKSTIGVLEPVGSIATIIDSAVGFRIRLSFSEGTLKNLKPQSSLSAMLMALVGIKELSNVTITSWSVAVGPGSNITIENSDLREVYIDDINSNVTLIGSNVGRVTIINANKVNIKRSQTGLNVFLEEVDATVSYLGMTDKEENISIEGVSWNLTVIESKVDLVNVTTTSAIVHFENANITILIANFSSILTFSHSSVLQAIGIAGDVIRLVESWVRILNPGLGSTLYSMDSQFGLVKIFMYGSTSLTKENYVENLRKSQVGNKLIYSQDDIIDYTLYASMYANISAKDVPIFFVIADGLSRITMKDIIIQYPIEAEDDARIEILFRLEIQAYLDFHKPETANITIVGENFRYTTNAKDGYVSQYLYQAIITSDSRQDLGKYAITVKIGMFSSQATIYLWKPTRVEIRVFGVVTYTIIAMIIGVVVLIVLMREKIMEFLRGKRSKEYGGVVSGKQTF